MADDWGLCMDCKWWQIEPEVKIEPRTLDSALTRTCSRISCACPGDSGCNHFMAGEAGSCGRVERRAAERRAYAITGAGAPLGSCRLRNRLFRKPL
jgi:hypothetical protein